MSDAYPALLWAVVTEAATEQVIRSSNQDAADLYERAQI